MTDTLVIPEATAVERATAIVNAPPTDHWRREQRMLGAAAANAATPNAANAARELQAALIAQEQAARALVGYHDAIEMARSEFEAAERAVRKARQNMDSGKRKEMQ